MLILMGHVSFNKSIFSSHNCDCTTQVQYNVIEFDMHVYDTKRKMLIKASQILLFICLNGYSILLPAL